MSDIVDFNEAAKRIEDGNLQTRLNEMWGRAVAAGAIRTVSKEGELFFQRVRDLVWAKLWQSKKLSDGPFETDTEARFMAHVEYAGLDDIIAYGPSDVERLADIFAREIEQANATYDPAQLIPYPRWFSAVGSINREHPETGELVMSTTFMFRYHKPLNGI